jgi:hypothetical protein
MQTIFPLSCDCLVCVLNLFGLAVMSNPFISTPVFSSTLPHLDCCPPLPLEYVSKNRSYVTRYFLSREVSIHLCISLCLSYSLMQRRWIGMGQQSPIDRLRQKKQVTEKHQGKRRQGQDKTRQDKRRKGKKRPK